MTDGTDSMLFLPYEIQQILKRKSSRDLSSRFQAKLHMLLTFVANSKDVREMEEKIGCAWINDDEFKINKRILTGVLGIKLNTLNVNLHSLKFLQQKHNKDGWTLWKKAGFSKFSSGFDDSEKSSKNSNTALLSASNPSIAGAAYAQQQSIAYCINLGQMSNDSINEFMMICRRTWRELGNMDENPVRKDPFIYNCACRFKQTEQPIENAIDVLKAIITPTDLQEYITFPQFCGFLAMFGPEGTIMLKIASLLNCSNNYGQWLIFTPVDYNSSPNFFGFFDPNQPNCLNLYNKARQSSVRVWNMALTDALGDYIKNEYGQSFNSWDDYFSKNPVQISEFNY